MTDTPDRFEKAASREVIRYARSRGARLGVLTEPDKWGRVLAVAVDFPGATPGTWHVENLIDDPDDLHVELHKLRRALVFWNHDHQTSDMLRDRIAEVIERNADAIDQPYNMADAVLSAMRGWIDRLDQTLYDVIPQDDWGIVLEGDDE